MRTINGNAEDLRVPARPAQRVRVRVSNTDNGPMKIWTTGSYRLLAVDGTEVHQPTEVTGRSVTLTAGARAELEVRRPATVLRSGCSCPRRPPSSSDLQALIQRCRHSRPTSWIC
jgi:FtsP/CotA-like multicopper oxidase with cupredoxin domain